MQTTPRLIEPSNTPFSVDLILPEHVHMVWPAASVLLRPAIEQTGGRLSVESLYSWICAGQLHLWFLRDHTGAMVTEFRNYPTGMRVLHIVVLGGRDRDRWLGLLPILERWARERGCVKLEMAGRKGWTRVLPDWKATKISMEKDILDV